MKTEKELRRPLRFVTFPHFQIASPSVVACRVVPVLRSRDLPPVTAWEEVVGGVTSLTRAGLPQDGPNPIKQDVYNCK